MRAIRVARTRCVIGSVEELMKKADLELTAKINSAVALVNILVG